jgi:hypothetical protein
VRLTIQLATPSIWEAAIIFFGFGCNTVFCNAVRCVGWLGQWTRLVLNLLLISHSAGKSREDSSIGVPHGAQFVVDSMTCLLQQHVSSIDVDHQGDCFECTEKTTKSFDICLFLKMNSLL